MIAKLRFLKQSVVIAVKFSLQLHHFAENASIKGNKQTKKTLKIAKKRTWKRIDVDDEVFSGQLIDDDIDTDKIHFEKLTNFYYNSEKND